MRRPIRLVTDIDRIDRARDYVRQFPGPTFDAAKGPQHLAAGVENSRRGAFLRQRFLPGGEKRVVRFHRLRESGSALQFAPRFQT